MIGNPIKQDWPTLRSKNVPTLLLRLALAASFLSAVADRFGLWGAPGTGEVAWGNFENFVSFTALLNPYVPSSAIPALAWIVTILEILLALGLIIGFRLRTVAAVSAVLLFTFAVAMSLTTGMEGPLSYSVWTAAAASLVLATITPGTAAQ